MINQVEMFGVSCDRCKEQYECRTTGISFRTEISDIEEDASESGWHISNDGQKHYCPKCHTINDEDELIIKNLELHKQISFDEFIKHGLENGANVVNGLPWSWKINGKAITHENDQCYIVETIDGKKEFWKGRDKLIAFESGLRIMDASTDSHAPGSCPM
jgi:hypothetical protein